MIDLDRPCPHEDFSAVVDVNRLTEGGSDIVGYSADLRISCTYCGERFRFIGVKAGLMPSEPRCNITEDELRIPIRPASSDPDFGLGIPGFAITARET